MHLPSGFEREDVGKALDICQIAKDSGELVPPDAYDLLTYVANSDDFPNTIAELAILAETLEVIGIRN
jgi:hypothetical protein